MRKSVLLSAITLILAHSATVWACECARREKLPADQWLKTLDGAVFSGKALRVRQTSVRVGALVYRPMMEVNFQVESIWKGLDTSRATVFTGLGNGDCGVEFIPGRTYFVAANRKADGSWGTTICSTVRLDMSTLSRLGAGR